MAGDGSVPRVKRVLLLATVGALGAWGQLSGVIDIHAHTDPDSVPRSIDAIDLAKLAKARGMRGLVLKNHYESTASLAYVVRKEVPGIEIFGGIDLNRSVGGVNPAAVERMVMVKGGWGRVVWLPTFDSENQVKFSKEQRTYVSVSRNGELLPETKQVIALAAKNHFMLETGHSSAAEGLMIVREAAGLGAFIEFVYNGVFGKGKEFEMRDYAAASRAVGAKSCILSSDMGQVGNPLHPDGLAAFFAGLRKKGISQADIDLMSKGNPARALGLAP
jgi:hypothetical protein